MRNVPRPKPLQSLPSHSHSVARDGNVSVVVAEDDVAVVAEDDVAVVAEDDVAVVAEDDVAVVAEDDVAVVDGVVSVVVVDGGIGVVVVDSGVSVVDGGVNNVVRCELLFI